MRGTCKGNIAIIEGEMSGFLGCRGFRKLGVPFGGTYSKDYSILGVYIGEFSYFGKLPCFKALLSTWTLTVFSIIALVIIFRILGSTFESPGLHKQENRKMPVEFSHRGSSFFKSYAKHGLLFPLLVSMALLGS